MVSERGHDSMRRTLPKDAPMHLDHLTAFGLLTAIPCIIALTRSKDNASRTLLGVTLAMAMLVALVPVVGFLREIINTNLLRALAAVTAVLAIIVATRVQLPVIAALVCTGGLLLAAQAFAILR